MYEYLGSTDILMYDVFTVYVSSLALLVYNLTQIKSKRALLSEVSHIILSRTSGRTSLFLAVTEVVLISLYQHGLVSPINFFLGNLLGTGANYYGMIIAMPVLLPLLCWIIGVDPFRQIDLITPAYPLALFFMKLGCFCAGCCYGIPCEFYFFNLKFDAIPMQLVEAGIALLLFFFLLAYKRKAAAGTLLPVYTTLYSTIRFFTEFFRGESNVLWCFKVYHFLCLTGIILGAVQLVILRKYRHNIQHIFENSLPVLIRNKFKKES